MELVLKASYLKDLKAVPKYVRDAAVETLEKLHNAPNFEVSGLDIKKMEGQRKGENYYRIRIGEYRIGMEWRKPDVLVICLLSRSSMYKKFPPK